MHISIILTAFLLLACSKEGKEEKQQALNNSYKLFNAEGQFLSNNFTNWILTVDKDNKAIGPVFFDPEGWATSNESIVRVFPKDDEVYPMVKKEGNDAVKISSRYVKTLFGGVFFAGALFLGKFYFDEKEQSNYLDSNTKKSPLRLGVPYVAKPKSFSFDYQYQAGEKYYYLDKLLSEDGIPIKVPVYAQKEGTDFFDAYATLSKWENNQKIIIAQAKISPDMQYISTNVYKKATLNFTYLEKNKTPDSLTIVFTSSALGDKNEGADQSSLWIKNIQFNF